ncbi:ESF1 homolog [Armigeres subalbatus]|uniref:ESF1 homolog n=1 Tax=Armigeres subalbatus TaxID=124917 RepID=UPI002ED5E946
MAKPKKDKQVSSNVPKKTPATSDAAPSKIWTDVRFAHLVNDPRFKGIPKSEKKVKIDKRFQSMFKDEKFNVKHTVDKYGRKVKQTESDELRKYYEMGSESSEGEEQEGHDDPKAVDSDSDGLELDDEEKAIAMSDKVKSRLEDLEVDYARGEGAIASDSSSDDDSGEEDDGEEVFIEHVWGELDADAERTDESTRRLALCNIDWDRVRAVDIMVMLSSFLPRGSTILSITIYPSEFGKERLHEEEAQGPQELTAQRSDESDEEDLDEEAVKEKQLERLREYQLNRLKYYYAVVECDSVETADKLYKECDGVEYESTANKLDLRFIPDDMEFDDEPKEKCTELPEVGKYEPRVFTTSALNQSKVELTWDENDVERKEFNEKIRAGKLADVKDTDLKKYVACSSSEDDESEGSEEEKSGSDSEEDDEHQHNGDNKKSRKQDMIAKYKALLGDIKEQEMKEKDEKVGMEFSWKVNGEGSEEEKGDSDEEETKRENVNPFEKILEKAKEKKKRRKELKKKKKRGELNSEDEDESEDDTPYGVDLNDPFFASAFDEKEFDLKKPSKKSKTKITAEQEEDDEAESARKRAELELMLDDAEDDRSHFNLKTIQDNEIDLKSVSKSKRKRILKKSKKQIEEQRQQSAAVDDFEVNVDDDRFKAVYEKPEFNIDPTYPSFKKTKGMEKLIQEKLKKRPLKHNDLPVEKGENEDNVMESEAKKIKKDVSTSLLVKSIKRKIGK